MREIVYSETSPGKFDPAPSKSQLRKARIEAERRRQKREDLVATILILGALAVCGIVYVVSVLVAFGGWWVN